MWHAATDGERAAQAPGDGLADILPRWASSRSAGGVVPCCWATRAHLRGALHVRRGARREATAGAPANVYSPSDALRFSAGLIDEMHLVIAPALLGRGENLLAGIDMVSLGYKRAQHASSDHAFHVVLTK